MSANVRKDRPDARRARTRQALLDAFFRLVLERDYEQITIADIVRRAGVGRSTLYEHFANKDGILTVSLRGPFSVLAETVREPDNTERLVRVLTHFWANRSIARSMFGGPLRRRARKVLSDLIEQNLKDERRRRRAAPMLPLPLASVQSAEALLAPIAAWLTGEARCPAEVLAVTLRRTVRAMSKALWPD